MVKDSRLVKLSKHTVVFLVVFMALFAQVGRAVGIEDKLEYFKNYFVTGDYVVGGVGGMRGTGVVVPSLGGSFATGIINIGGAGPNGSNPVPVTSGVPAGIVAAFLYWQTDEPISAVNPSAAKGFFDGNPIVGDEVGDTRNLACNPSSAARYARVYRADVLRYLPVDQVNNVRLANGPHTVKLPDKAVTGPFTNGASLVIIYRVVVPGNPTVAPLKSVVIYDGTNTFNNDTYQTMAGFYQAHQTSSTATAVPSKLTPIVANGQTNFNNSLYVIDPFKPSNFNKPFTGKAGTRWDNPTFDIYLKANRAAYSFYVSTPANVCLTLTAVVTSTIVVDTDRDGLLDVWETRGMRFFPGDQYRRASFGDCFDSFLFNFFGAEQYRCVNLPLMGAKPNKPDIFVEVDWLRDSRPGQIHEHKPKYAALNAIAATFAGRGIAVHFDVGWNQGPNYQGQYFVPWFLARGGDIIEESTLLGCRTPPCTYSTGYSVLSWKRGFLGVKNGFPALDIPRNFDRNRKDIFHYALFAHSLAGPFGPTGEPLTSDPRSTSGIAERPGADFMVTVGQWRFDNPIPCDPSSTCVDRTGTALVQAGTLMHELGHNLGLAHAGVRPAPPCMPNYFSSMNYLYQTRGLTDKDGIARIDYSSGTKNPLNEANPSEAPGAMGTLQYRVRFFGPPLSSGEGVATVHCGGAPIGSGLAVRLEGPGPSGSSTTIPTPDWNRNGISDGGYSLDLNYDGVRFNPAFLDSNDWASLNLQQISGRRNVNGLSSDVGEDDLGEDDLGEDDLGEDDLGEDDLGEDDLGEDDLGEDDLGEDDLGEDVDFTSEISSPDPTSATQPLAATAKIDRITLTWGAPSTPGQIRHYRVYRSDPAHPTKVFLASVDGAPPVTTYDNVVNDFTHAGAACPAASTCYNTTYTYHITSVVAAPPPGPPEIEGPASNNASSEVAHVFVLADNKAVVYGAALPALTYTAYGRVLGSLSGVSCIFTISPLVPRNATPPPYSITCSGPATTSVPTDGVTYNTAYDDGVVHTPGTLTITKAPLTITAVTNTKTYDGNNSAAATPTVSGLQYSDTVTGRVETYDNKHAGTSKTLSVSAYVVNDGNGGNNYTVTTNPVNTGVINKAPLTITAVTNTKMYDGNTSAAAVPAVSGLQNGDTVTGLVETYDNRNAGTGKTLTVVAYTVNDGNSGNNYILTTNPVNTGVIDKAPLTITAVTNTKMYDGNTSAAGIPVITLGSLISPDSAVFTETYDNKNAGTGKTLTPAGSVNDGNGGNNYAIIFVPVSTGVITPRPLTITADAKTKSFGNPDPPLTYQITSGSLLGGDSLSGNLARVPGEDPGTYQILQGAVTAGGNYNLGFIGALLTITPTIPSSPSYFGITISNVSVNGGSNIGYASPGGTFSVSMDYSVVNDAYCPNCIDQIVIGFSGSLPDRCIYSANPGLTPDLGSATETFTAPIAPGTYYLAFDHAWFYTCPDALAAGWGGGTPVPNRYIAAVIVAVPE